MCIFTLLLPPRHDCYLRHSTYTPEWCSWDAHFRLFHNRSEKRASLLWWNFQPIDLLFPQTGEKSSGWVFNLPAAAPAFHGCERTRKNYLFPLRINFCTNFSFVSPNRKVSQIAVIRWKEAKRRGGMEWNIWGNKLDKFRLFISFAVELARRLQHQRVSMTFQWELTVRMIKAKLSNSRATWTSATRIAHFTFEGSFWYHFLR